MSVMTKRLDIINSCLQSIGEDPVTDADSLHPSAATARSLMERNNRAIQSRGWWFNKEYKIKLLPDTNGEVVLPSNTLKCDPSDPSINHVVRGSRLYDPVNNTFVIGSAVVCNLVLQLDIEDLPQTAFDFIMNDTTHKFYVRDDYDQLKAKELKDDATTAWIELKKENLAASDVNSSNRQVSLQLWSRLVPPIGGGFGNSGSQPDPETPGG